MNIVTKEEYDAARLSLEGGHEYGNRWEEPENVQLMNIEGRFGTEELQAFIIMISYRAQRIGPPPLDYKTQVSAATNTSALQLLAACDAGQKRWEESPHPHLIDVNGAFTIPELYSLIVVILYRCQLMGFRHE